MKLKGRAKITLRDKDTGRIVHTEEHTNNLTPALTRIFGGDIAETLDYNKLLPIVSKLLGGVCLFNGTVSASDVFLPKAADASLTAHAGQANTITTANDPKRGILSSGVEITGGFKWTWEWTSSQGNGQITDIVLTHADTGDYWNESTPNSMEDFYPVEDVSNGVINPGSFGWTETGVPFGHIVNEEKIPIAFLDDLDHVLTIEGQQDKIVAHLAKFTGSGAWLWNALADVHDEETLEFAAEPWSWGNFENFGIGCFYVAVDAANKKLYAVNAGTTEGSEVQNKYLPYSDILRVNCLDLTNGTISTSSISCGSTLSSYSNYERTDGESFPSSTVFRIAGVNETRDFKQVQIVNGSVILPVVWVGGGMVGSTDCSIRINLTNSNDQEIVKGFENIMVSNYRRDSVQIALGKGRVMNTSSMAWLGPDGKYKGQAIPVNLDLFKNTAQSREVRQFVAANPTNNPVQFFTYCASNSSAVRGCMLNKLYAATVYHVDSQEPIIKNASTTMTVEYSLFEEVES